MITHVVCFKLTDPGDADKVVELLTPVGDLVEAVRGWEVGVNVVDDPRAYDVAVIARLDSRDDLATYQADPEHLAIVSQVRPLIASAASVDFES